MQWRRISHIHLDSHLTPAYTVISEQNLDLWRNDMNQFVSMSTLAENIFLRLWKDKYIKGSSDKWHAESLKDYQRSIITKIEEAIYESQGPNDDSKITIPPSTQHGRGSFKLTEPFDHLEGCDGEVRDGTESSNDDGADRVGADPSPIPCS